jgi:hypothetical protein
MKTIVCNSPRLVAGASPAAPEFRKGCRLPRGLLLALALVPVLWQGSAIAQSVGFQPNVDRPGLDFRDFDLRGDAASCQETCRRDQRCRAWTWVKAGVQGPTPRCWLKTAAPRAVRNSCCTSGVVTRFD